MRVHTRKRGSMYHYVCRVPRDLQHLFPTVQITQSLKTTDERAARIAATAAEYRTQQLFLQLRTGMLPKDLEKHLIANFLSKGLDNLEAIAVGRPNGIERDIEKAGLEISRQVGHTPEEAKNALATVYAASADLFRRDLQTGDTGAVEPQMADLATFLKEHHGVTLSPTDKKSLSKKYLNAAKQLDEAMSALYRGEWSPMELLREKVERDLATPYFDLKTVLERYQDKYHADKAHLAEGSKKDMEVECRTLLEIFGNVSINDFNTLESVTKLKQILRKYPKNRIQRFGSKSIHAILKERQLYEVINPKTANNYLDRARQVVDFANRSEFINKANVYVGERFNTNNAAEEDRAAYDAHDIRRLIDAICTQPLWIKNPPHPERFWLILIALFHGFRLGNIIALTKEDICQTDKGTWIFRLRAGKTTATVRPVAICDSLLLLGFLEWVEKLPRKKLFQDSSRSFSAWYNRNEVQKNGKPSLGFEPKYVTTDKGKCLYSLRHSFAGNVFDVTEDYKITSDMMGHSAGKHVTARYIKRTKAETLKEITEKMQMGHIDLDRLEARARELFGVNKAS
ncbi:integrase [Geomonas sp. Red276]